MSSIRETVQPHIPGGVAQQAEPAITALEEREAIIANTLREVAVQKGLTEDQADEVLVQVGLVPDPSMIPDSDPSIPDLHRRVSALEDLADQHLPGARARAGRRR